MRLGQDLAQALGEGRPLALTRIEGGLALRTSGVALALLDDRLMVIHWTRAEEDLRRVQECVTRSLGAAFLVEDARMMRARGTPNLQATPRSKTELALESPDKLFRLQPQDDGGSIPTEPHSENPEPYT